VATRFRRRQSESFEQTRQGKTSRIPVEPAQFRIIAISQRVDARRRMSKSFDLAGAVTAQAAQPIEITTVVQHGSGECLYCPTMILFGSQSRNGQQVRSFET